MLSCQKRSNQHGVVDKNISSLKNGDIIFQESQSSQSRAIALATHSKYTHCGIIYISDADTLVYEAVQPVKLTPINQWIARGTNNHYAVKRLKNADKILMPEKLKKMQDIGNQFIGKNYDSWFGWSDEKIYCSELIWKIYKRGADIEVGKLQKLSDFDLTNKLVKQQLEDRYGNNIPMNELVISPRAIFESAELITVKD